MADRSNYCPFEGCSKAYTCKFNLKRHMDAMHSEEGKFECEICHRLLSSRQNLREHLFIHTGESPYSCKEAGCGQMFRHASQLSVHRRVHKAIRGLSRNTDFVPIKDFEIVRPLGRGAYSSVFQVKSRHNGQEFAMKVIDKAKLAQSRLSTRLRNEIRLQKQLNHPCVVKLYHFFEDEKQAYLFLELCSGGELYTLIKSEGALSEEETRHLMCQLVEGLTYLHNKGVLHRDLKLGNLLLSEDKTALKIADFGLAVQLQTFEEERSTVCGTPNYISPEVVSRQPYGLATDLWSLGCIIYACLIGHPPFESQSVQDTLFKLKEMQFVLPEYLSLEARDLISSLLVWDSQDRLNIYQVRSHQFFNEMFFDHKTSNLNVSEILDNDCTYYEYSEARIKEHLSPINTENLPALKHRSPKADLEITGEGWVKVAVGSRKMEISSDGLTVFYQGKMTSLSALNRQASKLYQFAGNFIEVVKSKTPKVVIEENEAVFMLMMNTPCPNFESNFRNGVRVTYQVGSETFTVYPLVGREILVNPYQDLESLDSELYRIIERSMNGLKKALVTERGLS